MRFNLVLLTVFLFGLNLFAQTQTTILEVGKLFENEIAFEQKHNYKLSVADNSYVYVSVEQKTVDLAVTVISPSGSPIITIDSPNGRNGLEEIKIPLEKGGEYLIEIKAIEKGSPVGRYSAKLVEIRSAEPNDYKRFRAFLARKEGLTLAAKRTAETIKQGITKLEEAEQLLKEINDPKAVASLVADKAQLYQIMAENDKAISVYQEAVSLGRAANDSETVIRAFNNIAFVYHRTSDYQNALTYMRLSLEEIQKANLEKSTYMAFHNIGAVYSTIGEEEKAVSYYNQALEVSRKHNLDDLGTLQGLGVSYSANGDYQKGLEIKLDILPKFQTSNRTESEISILGRIASDYFQLKNYPKSLEYYNILLERSLARNQGQGIATARLGLGKNYCQLGEIDKALENLNVAFKNNVENRFLEAEINYWTGQTERKAGRLTEAEAYLKKSVDLIESVRNRISNQDLRTAFFSKSNRLIYEGYLSLLIDLHQKYPQKGYDKQIFAASEKSRARSLLESLAVSRVDIRQGINRDLLEKEKNTRKNLSDKAGQLSRLVIAKAAEDKIISAKNDYAKAEEELRQIEAQIRQENPNYAALTQIETVSLEETQTQLLDKDTALLEYLLGETKSHLLVVTQNSMQIFELAKRTEIESQARAYFEVLTARNAKIKFETTEERKTRIAKSDAELQKLSNNLSQTILAPAVSALNKKRLLIVASDILQYIPFASLSLKDKQALVANHEVISLPSVSTLAVLRKQFGNRPPAAKTMAVLADPVYSLTDERLKSLEADKKRIDKNTTVSKTRSIEIDENDLINEASGLNRAANGFETGSSDFNFVRLPFTRKEAEAISATVPAATKKLSLDFSANLANATNPDLANYQIIHFATHSFLNSRHPELSGIVLSLIDEDGKPQNGFLRTDEIYNLNFPAELVVLSGCRTGLGKEIRGEGLVGLTRGFMYAGAKRVAVSLWDVNDEATAELMSRFYKEMLGNKKLSPAAALRQAQLSMAKDKRWSNPYYWAGFILQGEPK